MSSDPVLREPLKHSSWQQIKRYKICLYGNRDMLQVGDMLITNQKKKGIVEYFTLEKKMVRVYAHVVKYRAELPNEWQVFVKNDKELIDTDETLELCLGEISKTFPASSLTMSHFQVCGKRLREKALPHALPVNIVRVLIETYLQCCRKMLHLHPLVRVAARSVSCNMDPVLFVEVLLNSFYPFAAAISNDEEDEKAYDFTEFTMIHRMNFTEGKCAYCQQRQKIAFCDSVQVCEPCYVQMRNLYDIFPFLESARLYSHSTQSIHYAPTHDADDVETTLSEDDRIFQAISKLLQNHSSALIV